MKAAFLFVALAGTVVSEAFRNRGLNWTIGQTVQTTSGPVSGHAASNKTGVSEYLGIPFAVPPIGDLRWTTPQKYTGNATINGTNFGFSCPANLATFSPKSTVGLANANITAAGTVILGSIAQVGDKFSEDCLTMNVWTKPQVGESKKAVLVWIYGGGFAAGNSDNVGYNGQNLADEQDVVLVSFNYRLDVLGFPGSPDTTQNLGLLDQRLAIEWVRDNIAQFGGDPSRITLFGQSAGGASVDYFTYAWTQDPIVNAFIPESGVVTGLSASNSNSSTASWNQLVSTVGCGNSTVGSSSALSCMRAKPFSELISVLTNSSLNFGPTVDEKVVFSDYISRSRTGNFIKKPILIGNTDYESGLFKTIAAIGGIISPESIWNGVNQAVFDCPTAARANISISNGVPTWRYRWFGDFPNTRLTSVPDSGAWHGSELIILFNTTPTDAGVPDTTPEEASIGRYLRAAWATFAKDPVNGLKNYEDGWPNYEVNGNTLIRLAYQNKTGTNLAIGNAYDTGCPALFPINGSSGGNATSIVPNPTITPSQGTKETAGYLLSFLILGVAFVL